MLPEFKEVACPRPGRTEYSRIRWWRTRWQGSSSRRQNAHLPVQSAPPRSAASRLPQSPLADDREEVAAPIGPGARAEPHGCRPSVCWASCICWCTALKYAGYAWPTHSAPPVTAESKAPSSTTAATMTTAAPRWLWRPRRAAGSTACQVAGHDEWPFSAKRTRFPSTDRAEPGCRSTSGASSELMRLTFLV